MENSILLLYFQSRKVSNIFYTFLVFSFLQTKKIIYAKRELVRRENEIVKLQHIQAVQELSHEVVLTTDNRKCNRGNSNSIRSKYKYFGCRAV